MKSPNRKSNIMMSMVNKNLIDLPSPINMSNWWNMGSILGMMILIQLLTGVLMSMHFNPSSQMAFNSVIHIMKDVNNGWLIRFIHMNGASMMFISLYLHVARAMIYSSYKMMHTWNVGVVLMILSMATAFTGYVLPWGQMSLWGATVITNLFSAIPYMGPSLVKLLWGGFSVDNPTLNRFFSFHFILPFMIIAMTLIHLLFSHMYTTNNPLGSYMVYEKIPFHPYHSVKDLLGFIITITILMIMVTVDPNLMSDPDNYKIANPLSTPEHIKPEWYFLWAYAILRSIPNKLGGVLMMFSAIFILMLLPLSNLKTKSAAINPKKLIILSMFFSTFIILSWIGAKPIEHPFDSLGLMFTLMYFTLIIFMLMI